MASNKNMSEISKQLNHDMEMGFAPKTISDMLAEISLIHDFSMKSSKFEFYIDLLEEELRKVGALQRELPHCMQLLQDGIETLKKERLRLREREEGAVVVTEEFIPISISAEREENGGGGGAELSDRNGDKTTWMSRVRLWTAPLQFHNGNESFPFKPVAARGDIHTSVPLKSTTMAKEGKRAVPVKDASTHKKQRRCWSPELHNRFVDALHNLGGPYVAKPKQIRELMNVDGLTNDEVKSHLQKYRLHIRKLLSSSSVGITHSGTPEELLLERGSTSGVGGDEGEGEGDARKR